MFATIPFDPRSIIAITGLVSVLCALTMLYLRRGLMILVRGTRIWALGVVVMFVALVMMGQRGRLPDWWTLLAANIVLWSGMSCCIVGLSRAANRPGQTAALVVAGVAFAATTFCFGMWRPDYALLLIGNAFFIGLFAAFCLHAVYAMQPRRLPVRFMIASYACLLLVCVLRIGAVLAGIDTTAGLLEANPIQSTFLAAYGLSGLVSNAAFLLVVGTRQHEALRRAAAYDPLSGLLNRGAVMEMLKREVNRACRQGGPLSILMIDIDHFKRVNDSHGHAAGDQIIVEFARRGPTLLRGSDCLGRYGGEEFLALLPETDAALAVQVAERMRLGVMLRDSAGPSYTVSIGVAGMAADMTLEHLLAAADGALYLAKANGRNRVEAAIGARPAMT